ncbi:MAG: YlxR family protein [Clostridia bacterium]
MIQTRSCIACRKRASKSSLIKIVASEDKNAIYDTKQKINSRSIYFCHDIKCIEKSIKLLLKNKLNVKIDVDKEKLKNVLEQIGYELGE